MKLGFIKKPKTRTQWITLVGVVLLFIVLVYVLIKNNSVYKKYEVVDTISRSDNTSVYYSVMKSGMLRYSKDGASMTNEHDQIIWNETFQMSNPIMESSNNYTGIADMGGNDIYIFDVNGLVGKMLTDVPIQMIQISEQGVVGAILSDATSNYINLYSRDGNLLISIKATLENTGYPLTMALSSDATRLAVSYIHMNESGVQTKAVFYDFQMSEVNQVIGSEELEGLYPKMVFLDKARVALIGENGFDIYSVGGTVQQVESIEFDEEIRSMVEGNDKIGFVFKNSTEEGKYRIEIYDRAAKKNATIYTDLDYRQIEADDEEVIVYNDDSVAAYQYDGNLRFNGSFDSLIEGVLPSWDNNHYWIISEQSIYQIRIK